MNDFRELLGLAQLHLLQTHGPKGKLLVGKENLAFYHIDMPKQAPKQTAEAPASFAVRQPLVTPKALPPAKKTPVKVEETVVTTETTEKTKEPSEQPEELKKVGSKHLNLSEMFQIVSKLYPSQNIVSEIPSYNNATDVLLVNDSSDQEIQQFVKKVAEAIASKLHLVTKVVSLLDTEEAKLVIGKQAPTGKVFFISVEDWAVYLQDPKRKVELWQAILKWAKEKGAG